MTAKNIDLRKREPYFLNYDERKDLHITVDKQEGVYLGHPSTATLADGKTIFMVYPKSHGFGQIVMKKSEDGGRTWSERLHVPDSFSTNLECPTIYRMEDASGKSRLITSKLSFLPLFLEISLGIFTLPISSSAAW